MQSQAQDSHGHIQQLQEELQKAKEALQHNLDYQKELQQSHNQEVTDLKTAVSQAEIKVRGDLNLAIFAFLSIVICKLSVLSVHNLCFRFIFMPSAV